MTVRLIVARPLPGTMGESSRVAHTFEVSEAEGVPERLTARCGATFGPGQLEHLDPPSGMPCTACLLEMPRSASADLEAPDAADAVINLSGWSLRQIQRLRHPNG
jgi:hypothetical protein